MSDFQKVTGDMVLRAVKEIGRSCTAKEIAYHLGIDTRTVATAMRGPISRGQATIHYRRPGKGQQVCGHYRFRRLALPKDTARTVSRGDA